MHVSLSRDEFLGIIYQSLRSAADLSNIATLSLRFLTSPYFLQRNENPLCSSHTVNPHTARMRIHFPMTHCRNCGKCCILLPLCVCVRVWESKHFHLRALAVSSHYNTHPVRNLQRIDGQAADKCQLRRVSFLSFFSVINRWAQQTNQRSGGCDRSRLKLCTESK